MSVKRSGSCSSCTECAYSACWHLFRKLSYWQKL